MDKMEFKAPTARHADASMKLFDENASKEAFVESSNRAEIDRMLAASFDGEVLDALPEDSKMALESERQLSDLEALENAVDPTLSDDERLLTDRQLKFAWALARARASGKINLKQCALEAGYSESKAGSAGPQLAKHPVVCRVALARMPEDAKLKRLVDMGAKYPVSILYRIAERAMQDVPVLDKLGNPVGTYVYDGALALRAAAQLGAWMGLEKKGANLPGIDTEEAAKEESSEAVEMKVLSIADRIRRHSRKPTPAEPGGDPEK